MQLPENQLQEKLAEFQCQRCHECCRKPGFVYLKSGEAKRIADYLSKDEFDFVNEFCELQERQKLVLKKDADEACVFLDEDGCSIHAVKPQQCQDFPVRWRTKSSFEYCEGMKKLFKS